MLRFQSLQQLSGHHLEGILASSQEKSPGTPRTQRRSARLVVRSCTDLPRVGERFAEHRRCANMVREMYLEE